MAGWGWLYGSMIENKCWMSEALSSISTTERKSKKLQPFDIIDSLYTFSYKRNSNIISIIGKITL